MSEFQTVPDAPQGVVQSTSVPPAWTTVPSSYPTIGRTSTIDSAFDRLIAPSTPIEVLASGFAWSEGPVWVREGDFLLFSDIPNNSIFQWSGHTGLSLYMKPSGYTGVAPYGREPGSNGLTLDPTGCLVLCEHGDRRVSRLEAEGGKVTVADRFEGKRLNSPNDLVYRKNGDLFFTDPPYGLPKQANDPRRELDFCGVYRVKPTGEISLEISDLNRPNGLAFSPDHETLYVAQSDAKSPIIMAYEMKSDGGVGIGRVFADVSDLARELKGLPDGLKVDRKGNIFTTGPGGVLVYSPHGKLLGRIDTGERIANVAWGEDGSVLYLCSDMYLCRIRTNTVGAGW